MEVTSTYPNIGCTNSLFVKAGKQIASNYDVVQIDLSGLMDDEANMIAMCPSCAQKYRMHHDSAYMAQIKAIKKRFIELAEIQDVTASQNIEEEIVSVLSKIP